MTDYIQTISNIIYDVKENITDSQYKSIMECLMELNKNKQDVETDLTRDFYKQFFYHSHKNNNCFFYLYVNQDNSLWTSFEYQSFRLQMNSQFIYSKVFNSHDKSIAVSYTRIVKIMPKYCVIDVDGFQKKISNKTLSKLVFFPYIEII